MSVINQMLKDLDDRKHEPEQVSPQTIVIADSSNKGLRITVVLLILVLVNIIAWFIWHTYQENQQLKSQKAMISQQAIKQQNEAAPEANEVAKKAVTQESVGISPIQVARQVEKTAVKENTISTNDAPKNASKQTVESIIPKGSIDREIAQQVKVQTQNPVVTANQAAVIVKTKANEESAMKEQPVASTKPSMVVARKKLTPEQLISRKKHQAEIAVAENNLAKAEQLYEDILLIDGGDEDIRKQLAALWYGRKAYQSAINLLHQGNALDYNNSEFRLMKSRIYLTMGQTNNALTELLTLKDANHLEYQALIASTAQQLQQYQHAIYAYQKLTQLQSSDGRWWLGLAIAYDSNANFDKAAQAYKTAMSRTGISDSSMAFARQRLQELGE